MSSRTVSVNLVANIGQYVGGMNAAAGATMRLGSSVTDSTTKAKSGFDTASKGALIMGAAVVGGIGMAISKSMEFEKSMSAVQAATGATVGTLGDLRAAAMRAGADTQYSATEAANGITEMAKAGVSAKDIMGGGLKGALSLAAAGQLDVADAAGIASVAMTQFNLSGQDLPHVADLLAAGAGKAMGSVDDLGQALNQSGLIASAAGLSIEETTGTLSAFANAGLIGSDAGTSFKTMLQALQAPSGKAAELMAQLGINMYDSQGNMLGASEMAGVLHDKLGGLSEEQRNSALATIFGSDAVRAANVLYKEGAGGIQGWIDKVDDQGYAAKQAAALTDNLSGDLERLGGSFETLLITLGSGAQGPLRELVQMLGGLVDGVTWAAEAFGGLPGPLQGAVMTMGALAALGGPLDLLFTRIAVGVTSTVTGMGMAAGATTGLGLAASAAGGLVARLAATAVPLALLAVSFKAVSDVMDFMEPRGRAASASIQSIRDSIDASEGSEARLVAIANGMNELRDKAAAAQEIVQAFKDQNWFNEVIWKNPFGSEAEDASKAEAALASYRAEIERLEGQSRRTDESTQLLAEKFKLTGDEVVALADKYGINLTGAVSESQRLFENFYSAEYGTTPTDAANATAGAMQSAKAQTEEAKKAQEDWLTSLQDIATAFVDPLAAYQGLLQEKTDAERASAEATAASTESSEDSWKDYVSSVDVSLGELATRLEDQITEQANWRTNIGLIAQWAGADVANYLAKMGTDGVDIVSKMADGTTADAQRMATDIRTAIQNGSIGWSAEMDNGTKVMEAIGKAGAAATVSSIATQLGLGVDQVAAIAQQYGVKLADGVNPLLQALGKGRIRVGSGNTAGTFLEADGGVMDFYAKGGVRENHVAQIAPAGSWRVWAEPETGGEAYIPLSPAKRGRSLDIWQETGKRLGVDVQAFAQGSIVDMGHRLQAMGGKVAEHPAFPPLDMHGHGATSLHYCVPMDTQIVTRRGVLSRNAVRVGDETLGRNPATGKAEWTRIREVVQFEDAEVLQASTSRWSARFTPNHRWVVEPLSQQYDRYTYVRPDGKTGGPCPECSRPFATLRGLSIHRNHAHGIKSTNPLPRKVGRGISKPTSRKARLAEFVDIQPGERLRLAVESEITEGAPLSLNEVAILAWAMTDGTLRLEDRKTLGPCADIVLYQKKPEYVAELHALLKPYIHTFKARHNRDGVSAWFMRRADSTELMKRAGLLDGADWVKFVLSLSSEQAAVFLRTCQAAEGTGGSGAAEIAQSRAVNRAKSDAIALAAYLCGHNPGIGQNLVSLRRPRVQRSNLKVEALPRQQVWCVVTDLGTWTMVQGDQVMLTGNSGHAIDVNTRPGTSALEQSELAPMAALARSLGFRTIFMAPGHFNHLHVDDGGTGSIGSTGVMATVELPKPPSTAPYQKPISTVADAMMQKAYDDAMAWVSANTIAPEGEGFADSGNSAGYRALGRQIADSMGLGGQFGAIDSIFTRESGWNPNAQNPTSTAYGIPQFLNATWAAYGGKTSDPGRQIKAGIQYMIDRYGSPNGAKAFWDSHHWYRDGGITGPVYHNGTDYVPQTGWAYLERGEAVVPKAANPASREFSGGGRSAGGGSGPVNVEVQARVFVGDREITDIVRTEATAVVTGALRSVVDRGRYNS